MHFQTFFLTHHTRRFFSLAAQIPPSYCTKLVEVMRELQRRRQGSAVFAGKDGFITARDLLRCVAARPFPNPFCIPVCARAAPALRR